MRSTILFTTILLAGLQQPAAAQNAVMMSGENSALKLELLHPTFDGSNKLSLASGAAFLGADIRLSPRSRLVVELPFARSAQEFGGTSSNSSTIGNPYIGIMRKVERSWLEVGIRLPLASADEEAAFVGLFSDQNRLEAFLPEVASLRFNGSYATSTAPTHGSITIGTTAMVPTGSEEDMSDVEVFLDYAGRFVLASNAATVTAGVEGRLIATEEGNLGERTEHQLSLSASYDLGGFRPGVQARIPLDSDTRDLVHGSFGILLVVPLK